MSVASVALSPSLEESMNFPGITGKYGATSGDLILIFLTVAGSVIPMRIMESDSIASVKLRIQRFKGFFVKKQKLVFEGRELARNNSPIRDYGLADGKILHLVTRLSDLQAITVRTLCGKEFELHIERSRNVGYLKREIATKGCGLVDLWDHELTLDGEELDDQRLITDLCTNSETVIHLLVQKSAKVRATPIGKDFEVSIEALGADLKSVDSRKGYDLRALSLDYQVVDTKVTYKDFLLEPLIVNPKIELPLVLKELVNSTLDGLENGNGPIQSSDGSGGAYFMQDSSGQMYTAVFKPVDEEPKAVNNPQGLPVSVDGEGLKKGTRVGEGALREVAAYILDHPMTGPRKFQYKETGFAGVPPTVMVKCLHKGFNHPNGYQYASKNIKIGSLQMFVSNIGSCEDMGFRAFPVDQVQRISVLDIRLANTDRHAGNILVSRDTKDGQIALIPIDHGYCLPNKFEDCTFEWLYWPQAREPYFPETIEYINSLDAEQDIELLRYHGWEVPPECARVLRISTMLLKKGVAKGLTPFIIGSIMCRETLKKESVIERIICNAEEASLPGATEDEFINTVAAIMDHFLEQRYWN